LAQEVVHMSKQRIVVGVDGSQESRDALLWAAEQARAVGGSLRVVYAWSPPGVVALDLPPMIDWEPFREHAKEFPGAFAREVLGDAPDVEVVPAHARCPLVIVHRPTGRKRRPVRRETLAASIGGQ
jgi:nucleotide-binding universal stress UspA family protein